MNSLELNSPMPPLPVVTNFTDAPEDSARVIVSVSSAKLNLWWDYDHGNIQAWVADSATPAGQGGPGVISSDQIAWYYGVHPDYTLTLRRYWRVCYFEPLGPGVTYTEAKSVGYGVSSTETATMGAELGIDVGGLSAKVSGEFSTSVTISQETMEVKQWSYTVPSGKRAIFAMWQLIEEVVALDPAGNIVSWPYGTCGAQLGQNPIIPQMIGAGMKGDLGMRQAQFLSPTNNFYAEGFTFDV